LVREKELDSEVGIIVNPQHFDENVEITGSHIQQCLAEGGEIFFGHLKQSTHEWNKERVVFFDPNLFENSVDSKLHSVSVNHQQVVRWNSGDATTKLTKEIVSIALGEHWVPEAHAKVRDMRCSRLVDHNRAKVIKKHHVAKGNQLVGREGVPSNVQRLNGKNISVEELGKGRHDVPDFIQFEGFSVKP
jgi:hypothetical protein